MAQTRADVLEVHHHDCDAPTLFQNVMYEPKTTTSRSGVTVFDLTGVQLADFDDIRNTLGRRRH